MSKLLIASLMAVCLGGGLAMAEHDPNAKARTPEGASHEMTASNGAVLVWYDLGAGAPGKPRLVMFPSAGREASDFNELALTLHEAGYPVWLVQPAGIDGAKAGQPAPDLMDLARDAAHLIDHSDSDVVLVGHAFGNRLARATATVKPEKTAGVVLLAAGGLRPIPDKARKALGDSFRPDLPAAEHEAAVRYGFFAEGNEVPDYWLRGWHMATGQLQAAAVQKTETSDWWQAGGAPLLVITGLQDNIAPPEDTVDVLEKAFPDQVTAVRIDGAGHALLPEKPDRIATAMLDWLAQFELARE